MVYRCKIFLEEWSPSDGSCSPRLPTQLSGGQSFCLVAAFFLLLIIKDKKHEKTCLRNRCVIHLTALPTPAPSSLYLQLNIISSIISKTVCDAKGAADNSWTQAAAYTLHEIDSAPTLWSGSPVSDWRFYSCYFVVLLSVQLYFISLLCVFFSLFSIYLLSLYVYFIPWSAM